MKVFLRIIPNQEDVLSLEDGLSCPFLVSADQDSRKFPENRISDHLAYSIYRNIASPIGWGLQIRPMDGSCQCWRAGLPNMNEGDS